MKIKKGDLIILILIVALIAAGLLIRNRVKSGDSSSVAAKTEQVDLVFTQLKESEWEEGVLSSLIEEYEGLHPEVSIREQPQGYDEIMAASAGEAAGPDLIVMDGRYLSEFIKAEMFGSLEPYIHSGTPLVPQPGPQAAGSPLEKWALPLLSSMDVLFYNIDILKAAGFDRPPRNRTEFLAYAKAVSKGGEGTDKQYGAALALSPADSRAVYRDVFSWIWAAGAELTKDGAPDFSNKAVTDTLAFLAQLEKEGLLAPQSFTATGSQRLEEFTGGKIAMLIGSVEDIAKVSGKMQDNAFGITVIPGPADNALKPVFGLSTWYGGIGAGSRHPAEAWAFLLYLRENSGRLAEQIRAVPGSGAEAAYITAESLYTKAWNMYEAADPVQELTAFPKIRELERAVREELAKLFANGQSSVADTAAAIQKQWE
ncbi:sugar ABC transporter substrate-binding protein [Spirochaetia bacterium]|nr:sugar ABC transporter substrate-binding protein [Spirochaetia bacterium]